MEMTPWSTGYRMDVVLAATGTTLISLYIINPIRALGWPGTLSKSSPILKGIFFIFWVVVPNNGVKMFRKPYCKQTCGCPGFVFHAQSTGRIESASFIRTPGSSDGACALAAASGPRLRQSQQESACPLKLWSQALTPLWLLKAWTAASSGGGRFLHTEHLPSV